LEQRRSRSEILCLFFYYIGNYNKVKFVDNLWKFHEYIVIIALKNIYNKLSEKVVNLGYGG